MTRLILSILLFLSSTSFGQTITLPDTLTKIKVTPTFFAIPGKTYVDSIEMDMSKTYLNPDNIKEVKSFKGDDAKIFSGAKGAILITRKKQDPFVSLVDIRLNAKTSIDTSLPTVYVINGIPVDTTSVKIEVAAIKSIDILKSSSNPELFHDTKKNVFILTTKIKNRKKKRLLTLGFMQVGLDLVTSANCKSQLQVQLTNYYQLLYLTSTIYFQSAVVIGSRNTNSQPA